MTQIKLNKTAGLLYFISGVVILMGIITAETYYPPGYATKHNEISDLGATRPPNSVSYEPSASIFNTTMITSGIMTIAASYFMFRAETKKIFLLTSLGLGVGLLGVGFFPGNVGNIHPLFAMLTFISGGIATITSTKITKPPFAHIAPVLGVISLVFLFASNTFIPYLGMGGTERWVAYPIVLWLCGIGGYLLNASGTTKQTG